MNTIVKWVKGKLGIGDLSAKVYAVEQRLSTIEQLVKVGVNLNFKSPSWIVVCLKGNKQDIVRFFELPDNTIAHLFEELKHLEAITHTRPVFDAPSYIKKDYLRLQR